MQRVVKAEGVKSEINVTPLVDVVLVLLIIFMVVTPMLTKGASVQLPTTSSPPKKPEDKNQILVSLGANGTVYVEKDQVGADGVLPALREAFERSPGSSVIIKGDKHLPWGDVKKVMLKVKEAGYASVGLISEKKQATVASR